jgi:hypothetical protein
VILSVAAKNGGMKVLIIGGSVLLGRALVTEALLTRRR